MSVFYAFQAGTTVLSVLACRAPTAPTILRFTKSAFHISFEEPEPPFSGFADPKS